LTWRNVLLNGVDLRRTAGFWQAGNWSLGHHTGIDFGAAEGTAIRAPVGGVVHQAGYDKSYGNYVILKMPDGYYMRFAHLSHSAVKTGDRIDDGGYIGAVGSTGRSSGAHLHLEVMTPQSGGRFGRNSFVNPVDYLDKRRLSVPADLAAPVPGLGGTTTSTQSAGSSGGISGVAGYSKKDYLRWLDGKFGSLSILRKLDKEARDELGGKSIDWLVNKLAKERVVDESIIQTYLMQTGWFKKYGADTSARLVAERQRPGVFNEAVDTQLAAIKAQLGNLGVTMSDEALRQIARDSYVFQWSPGEALDEAQKMFEASGDVTYDGGQIGVAQDDLEAAAFDLGVTLTEADIRDMRRDVIDGKGYQSQLDDLRERSANLYTVYADQIRAGQSLRSVAAGYFQKAAELLELGSPDEVDMDDPLFTGGRAFMTADPATGKMVPKGMWEFEKEIRKDSRWLETRNARDTVVGQAGQILSLMGLS